MRTERRNQLVLGALTIVLGVVIYQMWPGSAPLALASPAARGSAAGRNVVERGAAPSPASPDVHLKALESARPEPGDADRNLFRFRPKPTVRPAAPVVAAAPPVPMPTGPPPPPPVPAIPLRFIGVVDAPEHAQRIAVLSDERGVYHGREGDIIEGRYRILRVGVESIELAYVDGRGRQTIRLSGS